MRRPARRPSRFCRTDDRKAIAELDELDVISSNVIQDHVQQLEKFQWFMRSHLA